MHESAEIPRIAIVAAFIKTTKNGTPAFILVQNIKAHKKSTLHPIRLEPTGGKIEANEDAATAAIREAQEELGVTIQIVAALPATVTHSPEGEFIVETVICTLKNEPSVLETKEPNKLGGVMLATAVDLRTWVQNPPSGCILVPNINAQLAELCAILES